MSYFIIKKKAYRRQEIFVHLPETRRVWLQAFIPNSLQSAKTLKCYITRNGFEWATTLHFLQHRKREVFPKIDEAESGQQLKYFLSKKKKSWKCFFRSKANFFIDSLWFTKLEEEPVGLRPTCFSRKKIRCMNQKKISV